MRRASLLLITLLLLGGAGCSFGAASSSARITRPAEVATPGAGPSGTSAPPSAALAAASTSEPPPSDFSIDTVSGERFTLAAQRGKVVGVYFMASWCSTCVPETRAWGKLQQEYAGQGLEVLIVSADPTDTPADLERFRQAAPGAPQRYWAIDTTGRALVAPFQVRSLDTTLLFDRQGRLAFRDDRPTPYETLKRELERLLSPEAASGEATSGPGTAAGGLTRDRPDRVSGQPADVPT
jgi:thiol-disulfide isomerase/thioredoxin